MPTLRTDKKNQWMARRTIQGKQFTKMFGAGPIHGPEWRKARDWEENLPQNAIPEEVIPLTLRDWCRGFIENSKRHDGKKTVSEKLRVFVKFSEHCVANGISFVKDISPAKIFAYLESVHDERGPDVANRHLKNLKTAWKFGQERFENFPAVQSPFKERQKFSCDKKVRYVPPLDDLKKVMSYVSGQDLVMMKVFFYTGARAGEVFRLTWDDIDFVSGQIRLCDHKGGVGKKQRFRWLKMHDDLAQSLRHWHETRPCNVENVFMQVQNDSDKGKPFAHRSRFMPNICKRLGIKPFGFHAIRHKGAAIVYEASGLSDAQIFMGHTRATTTNIYVQNYGLYASHDGILDSLGKSEIGRVLGNPEKKVSSQESANS